MQIIVLLYVRSLHEGNFKLHFEILYKLLSWHYDYARWLAIHWFELYTIETKYPDIYNVLSRGNVSFQKSHQEFSRMGLIQ